MFEGESDTSTAHSLAEVPNALGVTVGAKGFKEEWLDILDQFERVYLVYDNDVVGQKGAEIVARRIGLNKTYSIVLPTDEAGASIDFNEWYKQGHSRDEFEELMNSAELFQVKDVTKLNSVLRDLEAQFYFNKTLDSSALKTPWNSLNKKLGGFFPGDLIVLSGRAKVGKTTFALNLAGHYILENIPSMIYCLEMREERLARKFIQWYRGVDSNMMTVEDVIVTEQMLSSKPLYFANSHSFTSDEIYDTIRESVRRYGLEFVIFDHLHFMIRSENERSNVAALVSAAVRNFKLLAEELRIPIMLICQPRKIQGANTKMTIDDLRDSSSIGQDADTVIIVHRDRVKNAYQGKAQKYDDGGEDEEDAQKIHESRTQVIVDATRYNPGGMTTLWYNGAISRYFKDQQEERKFFKHDR
jgi:replicative DNA helicase